MNEKFRLAIAGTGALFMFCSCNIGTRNTGDWEFPLIKASQKNSVARKAVSSNPQKDPFRSPDVTSLPDANPASESIPKPAPGPGPTPAPAPGN